jgi:hypothetical protein
MRRILPAAVLIIALTAAGCGTIGVRGGMKDYQDPTIDKVSSYEGFFEFNMQIVDVGAGVTAVAGSDNSGYVTTIYALVPIPVSGFTFRIGLGVGLEDLKSKDFALKTAPSLEGRISVGLNLPVLRPEIGFIKGIAKTESASGTDVDLNPATFYIGVGFGF